MTLLSMPLIIVSLVYILTIVNLGGVWIFSRQAILFAIVLVDTPTLNDLTLGALLVLTLAEMIIRRDA